MKLAPAAAVGLFVLSAGRAAADPVGVEFFETKVRPVLTERCYSCHGPQKQRGNLRLDSSAAMRQGGDGGPVIAPGDPSRSRLIQAVRQVGELKMPPTGRLTDAEIDALTAWIKMGTPWPSEEKGAKVGATIQATHWAFQPVRQPAVPQIRNPKSEVQSPIDGFVQAALQAKSLSPSPEADKTTLLRRVTFDLIGLPPLPQEIDDFLGDPSPDAYEKVVDRLLASPTYGERWGRHWLDLARYADSKGYVFVEDRHYPYAYTYRDYVIRAFNDDTPYDRFILEQLAADKLPLGDDKKPLAALGFLTLGRRFLNNTHDIIDDRIDVVTRGLLGLTVTCARCHDHKYDPIPQKDYYSLYGVFASCVEPKELPLIEGPPTADYVAYEKELAVRLGAVAAYLHQRQDALVATTRLTALLSPAASVPSVVAAFTPKLAVPPTDRVAQLLSRAERPAYRALTAKVEQLQATAPPAPPRAMVLADKPRPVEPVVFLRGNPANRGPAVPRQFLSVLAGPSHRPFTQGSGRLELAKAIAAPANPLTARVFVNRVWMHHFGRGLVATPSDFGLRSDPPSHPELLDYLADQFVRGGWSVKTLHKLILMSQTYRQKGDDRPECAAVDPENRLLWRFNRQRLDLEALRDSMLAVAGRLDRTIGGPAVDILKEPFVPRRTVYGFIDRQNLPGLYRTFDFASPDTHAPQRYVTTVPQQALFLMNSPFAIQQAQALAARPDVAQASSSEERINLLYRLLYARRPLPEEVEDGVRFVTASQASTETKLTPWEQYAQVLLLANEFAFVD